MIDKISKFIFFLYLILIPIRLFSPFIELFESPLSYLAASNSFVFSILGLLIILLDFFNRRIKFNKFILWFLALILILNISSLLNSIFINFKYGQLHGESSFQAVFGLLILYSQVSLIVFYNYYLIPKFTIGFFKRVFNFYFFLLMISGYLQLYLIFNPSFSSIYDSINILLIMRPSDFILSINRISAIGSEPASMVGIISFLVIPSELSNILEKKSTLSIFKILILLPIIYFSLSSTVYLGFIINLLIFSWFFIKKINFPRKLFTIVSLIITGFFIYSILPPTLAYFIFDKIFDTQNMSTAYRTSTLINDFFVFLRYPIFGIGNGNQGFYFNSVNWPAYFFRSQEFTNAYNGELGIINGGSFLPAFISAYGVFGIILTFVIFKKVFNLFSLNFNYSYIYYYTLLSIFTFLFVSILSSDIVGNYSILLSLSFIFLNKTQLKQ